MDHILWCLVKLNARSLIKTSWCRIRATVICLFQCRIVRIKIIMIFITFKVQYLIPLNSTWILHPYWQILENSSRNFSEISISEPISGEFVHHFFVSTYSVFVQYRAVHELDRFLENVPIFGWNFQFSVFVTPRNS